MTRSEVSHVELGFRFKSNEGFKGPNAYTTDNYLRSLTIPKNLNVGVMINASDLYDGETVEASISQLFPEDGSKSLIKFVRIASHFHELDHALIACNLLNKLGFTVGLNLMQISERTEDEIILFSKKASTYPIDVIYCADSVGGLTEDKVQMIYSTLKLNCGKIPLGFHAHDNLNLALSNTICALKYGATWLDCTVSGMGRGPGNTKTEELLFELNSYFNQSINFNSLFELATVDFYTLKKKYNWGTNIFYYFAAKHGIHPSYIQFMMNDDRFDTKDILHVLQRLIVIGDRQFFNTHFLFQNKNNPNLIVNSSQISFPKSIFSQKDVLIIGNGPSINLHLDAINNFILNYNPVVLAINYNPSIALAKLNYRLSCHPIRVSGDISKYLSDTIETVIPFSQLSKEDYNLVINSSNIKNFDFTICATKFEIGDNGCTLPSMITLAYSLAFAKYGNVKNIFLAGVDGYEGNDVRNLELKNTIDIFNKNFPDQEITSLTNSSISSLKVKSVYGY
jgi:4-hydroxy 2-oxovalerate aldolase